MNACTRLGAAAAALLVGVLAACGGGGNEGAQTSAAATTAGPAAAKAQIRQVWTAFFSSKTPASKKPSLLENGSRFASVIEAMSKSPLASRTSATVAKVALHGPDRATVVYTIDVAGTPALQHQTGTAVREDGRWKVGDESLCKLVALQGKTPAPCKSA